MKVVQINSVCGSGSTGKICAAVSKLLTEKAVENYIFYAAGSSDHPLGRKYMSPREIKVQALKARVFGNYGFQSKAATGRLIRELEKISPDIVHLHNLHSHNAHLGRLFAYLKEKKIKTFWTFHDCWPFTGYCTHYDMTGCEQWRTGGCKKCPLKGHYSWFFDRSRFLYGKKQSLLSGLDLTIVTPSEWMARQVEQSFFKGCKIKVIHNAIDLSVFSPRESDFRRKHGLEGKYIVLGVAFDWGRRKGLDVFFELYKRLDDRFRIVLVGTDDAIDRQLPEGILSIHRTQNQQELAEIYTAADVYVNPTREEVFGLVNVEANACGTPVVTFRTGGSPECIDETSGITVDRDDLDGLERAVKTVCLEAPFSPEDCIKRAAMFDQEKKFREYVELYDCQQGN